MFRIHVSAHYPHRAVRLAVVLKLVMLDVMSSLLRRTLITVLVIIAEVPQVLFQELINSFHLSISLGMTRSTEFVIDS